MTTHESPFDLNPVQRKLLSMAIAALVQGGQALTLRRFCDLATALLGWRVGDQGGPGMLAQLGYEQSKETEPQLDASGGMELVPTWQRTKRPKPMTNTERAQHLSTRISELTEVFVLEVLDDVHLEDATLRARASEMTRVFALELSRAVSARAKVGGRAILDDCAMIANLAFKAV